MQLFVTNKRLKNNWKLFTVRKICISFKINIKYKSYEKDK